jgi:hypothetical protein
LKWWGIKSLGPEFSKYLMLYLVFAPYLPVVKLASDVQLEFMRAYTDAIDGAGTAYTSARTGSWADTQVACRQGVEMLGYAMAAGH